MSPPPMVACCRDSCGDTAVALQLEALRALMRTSLGGHTARLCGDVSLYHGRYDNSSETLYGLMHCTRTDDGFAVVGSANASRTSDLRPAGGHDREVVARATGGNTWLGPISPALAACRVSKGQARHVTMWHGGAYLLNRRRESLWHGRGCVEHVHRDVPSAWVVDGQRALHLCHRELGLAQPQRARQPMISITQATMLHVQRSISPVR